MRQIPKPQSIETEGFRPYLNRTKPQHNDLDYDDFVRLFNSGVDKANLARAFSIDRSTLYKWLDIYEKEQLDVKK